MRRKFVLEEGGLDTGGEDSNGECEKILVEGCDCVSAVSVIVVPLCGSLLLQSSPYLTFHSTGDNCFKGNE